MAIFGALRGTGRDEVGRLLAVQDQKDRKHDLDYELLSPGESTAAIDKLWLRNAKRAAGSWRMRRLADFGYLVIRLYGGIR